MKLLEGLRAERLLYTHFGAHDRPATMLQAYAELLQSWVEEVRGLKRRLRGDGAVKQRLLEKYGPFLEGLYDPQMVEHEIAMNAQGVLQYLARSS